MDEQNIRSKVRSALAGGLSPQWTLSEKEHNVLAISHKNNVDKGLQVGLEDIFRQIEEQPENASAIIQDLVQRVAAALKSVVSEHTLVGNEDNIYPVLRNASVSPSGSPDPDPDAHSDLASDAHPDPDAHPDRASLTYPHHPHTAESTIYYALDLGTSYILIHSGLLEEADWSEAELHRHAMENLAKMDSTPKIDYVGDNVFYFVSPGDGYAASRVLNKSLIEWMKRKTKGELGVAIPHQDCLIFADIRDDLGYKALAQITMDFHVRGDVPISSLPYLFDEDEELEPFLPITRP